LLEKNQHKIDPVGLSENPNAIHLLKKNLDKIDWDYLSENPSIFELDYKGLKERCAIYKEELIAAAMHPSRFKKVLDYLEVH